MRILILALIASLGLLAAEPTALTDAQKLEAARAQLKLTQARVVALEQQVEAMQAAQRMMASDQEYRDTLAGLRVEAKADASCVLTDQQEWRCEEQPKPPADEAAEDKKN